MNKNQQIQNIADLIRHCGDSPEREGMIDTPKRHVNAMEYLTSGYKQTLEEVVNGAIFESDASEMVIIKDIELYSLCQHHLFPIIGQCHVAYLPNGKVIGLSKVARIVDMYAHRFQIQETMTNQIAHSMQECISANGVAVVIEAKHMCTLMRGIQKQSAVMTTSSMLGAFSNNQNTRNEFLQSLNRS